MESIANSKPESRKPNYNKWEDPISCKIINTRGVPAYIRNKLGLPWNSEYWDNKDKLIRDYELKISNEKLIKIKKVLVDKKIIEEVCYGILDDSILQFFWAINYSYQNRGPRGLSDFLRHVKDFTEKEKRKYYSRRNINISYGTGADLSTGSQNTTINQQQ